MEHRPLSESKAHPRAYGSFARILGKYVRDEKLIRMEDAIRRFTALPAQRLHLNKRGLVRPEYFADITIFDPAKIADVATFEDPNRPSVGIEYVLVNGTVALDHGKTTDQFAGVPLRGPGYSGRAFEGLPHPGRIQGVITDTEGWTLGRTQIDLASEGGAQLSTVQTRYDGKYELALDHPCEKCTLKVSRMGFETQQRIVNYNGTNSLWFGFSMKRIPNP